VPSRRARQTSRSAVRARASGSCCPRGGPGSARAPRRLVGAALGPRRGRLPARRSRLAAHRLARSVCLGPSSARVDTAMRDLEAGHVFRASACCAGRRPPPDGVAAPRKCGARRGVPRRAAAETGESPRTRRRRRPPRNGRGGRPGAAGGHVVRGWRAGDSAADRSARRGAAATSCVGDDVTHVVWRFGGSMVGVGDGSGARYRGAFS